MIPEKLFNDTINHQINLTRRANGIVRDVFLLLKEAEQDIIAQIITVDPTGTSKRYQAARLQKLLDSVRERLGEVSKKMSASVKAELQGLSKYEASNQAKMLTNTIPIEISIAVPATDALVSLVTTTPIQGRFFNEWMDTFSKASVEQLNQAIRIGVVEGETQSEIVRRVRGTSLRNGEDGVMQIRRNAAQRLVRTSVNHVTNEARQLTWAQNDDVVNGWTFVATLDSRTTLTCAGLNGDSFPIGEGPRPPRHQNCRSTTVSKLKTWRELGVDTDEFTPGQRSALGGTVSSDITFDGWLKGQPVGIQKEVLGPARLKLWKEGKFDVKGFTDSQGRTLTLGELTAKEA